MTNFSYFKYSQEKQVICPDWFEMMNVVETFLMDTCSHSLGLQNMRLDFSILGVLAYKYRY